MFSTGASQISSRLLSAMYWTDLRVGAMAGDRHVAGRADDDVAGIGIAAAVDRLGLLVGETHVEALSSRRRRGRCGCRRGRRRDARPVERTTKARQRVDDFGLVLGVTGTRSAASASSGSARRPVTAPPRMAMRDVVPRPALARLHVVGRGEDLRCRRSGRCRRAGARVRDEPAHAAGRADDRGRIAFAARSGSRRRPCRPRCRRWRSCRWPSASVVAARSRRARGAAERGRSRRDRQAMKAEARETRIAANLPMPADRAGSLPVKLMEIGWLTNLRFYDKPRLSVTHRVPGCRRLERSP